tara:strand:+ start:1234 stop:1554 length:321 start_codon:yes stop_codon:yes gene_type:complete
MGNLISIARGPAKPNSELEDKIKSLNQVLKKDYILIQKLTNDIRELNNTVDQQLIYIEEIEEFLKNSFILNEDICQANSSIIDALRAESRAAGADNWWDNYKSNIF